MKTKRSASFVVRPDVDSAIDYARADRDQNGVVSTYEAAAEVVAQAAFEVLTADTSEFAFEEDAFPEAGTQLPESTRDNGSIASKWRVDRPEETIMQAKMPSLNLAAFLAAKPDSKIAKDYVRADSNQDGVVTAYEAADESFLPFNEFLADATEFPAEEQSFFGTAPPPPPGPTFPRFPGEVGPPPPPPLPPGVVDCGPFLNGDSFGGTSGATPLPPGVTDCTPFFGFERGAVSPPPPPSGGYVNLVGESRDVRSPPTGYWFDDK